MRATSSGRVLRAAAVLTAVLAMPLSSSAEPGTGGVEPWPSRVSASYKVAFNGIEIGHFRFTSEMSGRNSYTLASNAELSALLGAFKWRGDSRSSGTIASGEPRPAGYTFDYKSNSKHGSVKMGFADTRVANVSILPPSDTHPETVPIKPEHMKDVLDPLSAVMAVSRGTANPCNKRIPIYDGKQRFDLIFSFRRQQKIEEARPSGQPGFAFVCRVRYNPIAGYRMNEQTKQMSSSTNIEVALRPVPSAGLVIPYSVSIPTFAGTATLTAHRVEITTQGKGQIALVH